MVGVFTASGALTYWNAAGAGRHLADGSRRYYLTDHLGSGRTVVDGTGTLVEARDYYPYGLELPGRTVQASPPTKEGFTGHETDRATGLVYAGARYYMPAIPRWTAVDPILSERTPLELAALHGGRLYAFSPYNYVYDSPTVLSDPDGKCVWPCVTAAVGATVGAAFGAVSSGVVEAVRQVATGEEFSLSKVAGKAGTGAISGAIAGAATGVCGPGCAVAGSAVGNAVGGAVDRGLSGKKVIDGGEITKDLAIGAAAGGVGVLGGKVVDDFATLATGKVGQEALHKATTIGGAVAAGAGGRALVTEGSVNLMTAPAEKAVEGIANGVDKAVEELRRDPALETE